MTRFAAQLAGIGVTSQAQRKFLGLSGKNLAAQVTGSAIMDSYRSSASTGAVAKSLGDQLSGSSAIMGPHRSSAFDKIMDSYRISASTGAVAKSLGDQLSGSSAIMDSYRGIAASSGIMGAHRRSAFDKIMDSYRSSASTGAVAKSLGDQRSGSSAIMDSSRGIAASSAIMDSYRGIAANSGIMGAHRRTLGIVSKSFAAQMLGTSGIDSLHRNASGITAHSLLFGERYRASTLGAISQLVGPGAPSRAPAKSHFSRSWWVGPGLVTVGRDVVGRRRCWSTRSDGAG